MKISFLWDYGGLCCNSCPFIEWDDDECYFRCSLIGEEVMDDNYNYDNPNERHISCPLIIEEES